MAATTHPDGEVQTYECGHCGGDRDPRAAVAGAFCSMECYRAHRREKRAGEVLELLEHDHRFCRTCARQVKEVEEPTESYGVVVGPSKHDDWVAASDVLVGYQYRTHHAETGEKSLDVDAGGDRAPVEDGVATGTVCRCGNTDHRHEETTIQDREPFTTAHNLARATRVLRAEDEHDVRLDRERLFDAVLERESIREAFRQAVILE